MSASAVSSWQGEGRWQGNEGICCKHSGVLPEPTAGIAVHGPSPPYCCPFTHYCCCLQPYLARTAVWDNMRRVAQLRYQAGQMPEWFDPSWLNQEEAPTNAWWRQQGLSIYQVDDTWAGGGGDDGGGSGGAGGAASRGQCTARGVGTLWMAPGGAAGCSRCMSPSWCSVQGGILSL